MANIFQSYFSDSKHKDNKESIYQYLYLTKEEAVMLPKFMCEKMKSVNYFKQLCPKQLPEVAKVLFADYEKSDKKMTFLEYLES